MIVDKFGQIVYDQEDLYDLAMQGQSVLEYNNLLVDSTVDGRAIKELVEHADSVSSWIDYQESTLTVAEFDQQQQSNWHMPDEYKNLDIAEHVLGLCATQEQLQRCGAELLLYQERNLFDLLRYLKYLVDLMTKHQVIWGVGRGSSVASYVLYLLGVHRIDSIHYDLDITEFLR
jgi:DNA polymerase III alpha subunit